MSVFVFEACESDEALEEDLPESPGEEMKKKKDSRVSKKEKGLFQC